AAHSRVLSGSEEPLPDMSVLRVNRAPPPKLPIEVFGPLASWLQQAAESKSAPLDYVAAALLSAAAGAIGATVRARAITGDWTEPAILWFGAVGAPSSNKSPAADAVFDVLRDVEREMTFDFD